MESEPFSMADQDGVEQLAGALHGGALHGPVRIYEQGAAQALMQFAGGVQQGPCVILHAPHRPMAKTFYQDGRLHGPAEYYAVDGTLVRKTHYRKGKLHGVQEDYYPNGCVCVRASYVDGMLDGQWQRYAQDGQLAERRSYAAGVPVAV
jgi:antitoxin component YwqK of YwqJK toxin-antitoxin module